MEKTKILQQYNQLAVQSFVDKAIEETSNPTFVELRLKKSWKAAYKIIVSFEGAIPSVIDSYNKEYYKVLVASN